MQEVGRTDGTVRFSDEREPTRNGQMILAALAPLPLVESTSARIDELIEKVSDLHHRVAPVGGKAGRTPFVLTETRSGAAECATNDRCIVPATGFLAALTRLRNNDRLVQATGGSPAVGRASPTAPA